MPKSRRLKAVSAVALALWTSTQDVRALSIPEVAGSTYYPCTQSELTPYVMSIIDEYNDCAPRTTYNWDSGFLPTNAQRQEMCACKLLIAKVQTIRAPHCVLYRISLSDGTTDSYSYKSLIEFALGYCSSSSSSTTSSSSTSSSTTSTTTTRTAAPTATPTPSKTPSYYDDTPSTYAPTYAPYTYAPTYTYSPSFDLDTSTSSSSKKGKKSKAGLIVGIVAAVGVVSAIAAFVVRKKRKNNTYKATSGDQFAFQGKPSDNHNSDVEAGGARAALDVQGEELSPLGVSAAATFLEMPPTPSAPAPESVVVKQKS